MKKTQTQLLRDHHLRRTSSRTAILGLFQLNAQALSHGDIEKRLVSAYDRVTVYRTLKAFVDRGVLHKVLDDEGALKYALCNDECSKTDHRHEHAHFKCNTCGETSCMDGAVIPFVNLPEGYRAVEMNMLIQGFCNRCSLKSNHPGF